MKSTVIHDSEYFKILNFNLVAGALFPVHSHHIDGQLSILVIEGEGEFLGDHDTTADGVIVEPGGPGVIAEEPPPPEPLAVGGEAYPVNKASALAPWLGLALVLVLDGSILTMRRRRAS